MPAAPPPAPSTPSSRVKTPQDLLADYLRESTPDANAAYAWHPTSPHSTRGLKDFLDRHPPSGTSSGKGPSDRFVWVCARPDDDDRADSDAAQLALAKSHAEMESLRASCTAIDADDRIPLRQTKAKGRSKAQRKKALAERLERDVLPQLATQGSLTRGKWLFFAHPSHVDATLRTLAYSIVDGPLSRLATVRVHSVKAGCMDQRREGENDYLVALFYDDVWDRTASTDVVRCLLRSHKLFARAAKSDLWSVLGIDSRHWSGITSSLYNYDSILPRDEQNELVELYEQQERANKDGGQQRGKKRPSEGAGTAEQEDTKRRSPNKQPIDPAHFWPDVGEPQNVQGAKQECESSRTTEAAKDSAPSKAPPSTSHVTPKKHSAKSTTSTTPTTKATPTAKTTPSTAKTTPTTKTTPSTAKTTPMTPSAHAPAPGAPSPASSSDTESEEEMTVSVHLRNASPSKSKSGSLSPVKRARAPQPDADTRAPARIRSALGSAQREGREHGRDQYDGAASTTSPSATAKRDRAAILCVSTPPKQRAVNAHAGRSHSRSHAHSERDAASASASESEAGSESELTAKSERKRTAAGTGTGTAAGKHRPNSARDMAQMRARSRPGGGGAGAGGGARAEGF